MSSPRAPGHLFNLYSPLYDSKDTCVSFWYHMLGNDVGGLKVLVTPQDKRTMTAIWSKIGKTVDRSALRLPIAAH